MFRRFMGVFRSDAKTDLSPPTTYERTALELARIDDARRQEEAALGIHGRSMTVVPGKPTTPILLDAQFLVWRRDQRGEPQPSLWLHNPKSMFDWSQEQQRTIAVIKLSEEDRALKFADIVARYPAPVQS